MLTPETVLLLRRVLESHVSLTFLVLLIVASSTTDCDPVLPVSYEELDALAAVLNCERSAILNFTVEPIWQQLGVSHRRFLASLKMSLIARHWTRTGELSSVTSLFDCYPSEGERLIESLIRILTAFTALANEKVSNSSDGDVPERSLAHHELKLRYLTKMLEAGLDEEAITLTQVPGIGPTWARRLADMRIAHLEELAQAEPSTIAGLRSVSPKRARRWVEEAGRCLQSDDLCVLREVTDLSGVSATGGLGDIDPYRLRRALTLTVTCDAEAAFIVTGGLDPHRVVGDLSALSCDCIDAGRQSLCKHVLAVRSYLGEPSTLAAVQRLARPPTDAGFDLTALWLS